MRYVKIQNKFDHPVNEEMNSPWWMLEITSYVDLAQYILEVKAKQLVQDYHNAKYKSAGILPLDGSDKHMTMAEHMDVVILESYDILNPNQRRTVADDIGILADKIYGPMHKVFNKYGGLLINQVGGMRPLNVGYIEVDELPFISFNDFPVEVEDVKDFKTLIRIFQWPNGKHWYAKIGNMEVILNGESKWNSYEHAKQSAELFLKEKSEFISNKIKEKNIAEVHSKFDVELPPEL